MEPGPLISSELSGPEHVPDPAATEDPAPGSSTYHNLPGSSLVSLLLKWAVSSWYPFLSSFEISGSLQRVGA